ncbi:MAG: insulinase family protein [Lachnospiraceae bacterium]|nr:insulinase family protein [Lachnospiraceae bacterium]
MKTIESLSTYELVEKKTLEDLKSEGYILRHKKSGARIALISNDDENKVFYIGFRTPPKDSTGVAHILEHSVLCGSKEFPIKDPFVELVKGSLNTFLNAMTYPDKTVYPVASCNDKDFQNLMHVYLDAVFYPNIYKTDKIFKQEGWHFDLQSPGDELTINGVVYNEMKGAFSSPDDVMYRAQMEGLYPDTTYGVESGGDPEVIPELTYENFLAFHQKFYHPANSYIYLYGDMDMVEKLEFMDEKYLSHFEEIQVDSEIALQKPFEGESRVFIKEYPISESEKEEESAYLSWNVSIADSLDKELYVAFQIVDYALCSAPGAPLKQALVDKKVGKDVYSLYESTLRQPYFSVVAKDTSLEKQSVFLETIEEVVKNIVKNGFDEKALMAGINYYEFKYREADFGSYPKGLMYGLQSLDSWLYDEKQPFLHIEANETFAVLRKKAKEGYFEELLQKYLLGNPHKAVVILKPKKGLAEENDAKLAAWLAEKKASFTADEIVKIVEETKALEEYQEAEDSKEDLAKIPLLAREDIGKEARKIVNEECAIGDVPVLKHEVFTNGIAYLRMIFECKEIPADLLPYLGIFKGCLGLLNTENYSYGDLFNEINIVTGGMSAVNNCYSNIDDLNQYRLTLEIKTKVLYDNISKAIELMREVLMTSDFTDAKRLQEIIAEGRSRTQSQMMSAGHSVAVNRALSYGSASAELSEVTSGVPFFRLVTDLDDRFEEYKEALIDKLQRLAKVILRKENLMVDFVGTAEGYEKLAEPVNGFAEALYTGPVEKGNYIPVVSRKNEGYMTSGQVQYVCRAGNFRRKGLPYTGALRILKVMMGYEYLWTNVRVKGGAYGCMCGFGKSGESYFVSYRDPNLGKTIDIYEKAAENIAAFEADERTMTQYIIGAISDLDTPMNPAAVGLFSLSAYMSGLSQEVLQKERDEMLVTTAEDVRALAAYIEAFMSEEFLCVVGNTEKIKAETDLFMHTENLF